MKGLREFEIAYIGLKVGVHNFNFNIDGNFFKHFEDSPIHDCDVRVKLEFEKKETFFILNFFIDGTVRVECDRCLEPFDKEIFGDYTLYIKFTSESPTDQMGGDDEVMYISRDESIIDVSHLVYEYICLCLPMQLVHPKKENGEEGCNPEVLKYLSKGEEAKEDNKETDPRWSGLDKLKFDKD